MAWLPPCCRGGRSRRYGRCRRRTARDRPTRSPAAARQRSARRCRSGCRQRAACVRPRPGPAAAAGVPAVRRGAVRSRRAAGRLRPSALAGTHRRAALAVRPPRRCRPCRTRPAGRPAPAWLPRRCGARSQRYRDRAAPVPHAAASRAVAARPAPGSRSRTWPPCSGRSRGSPAVRPPAAIAPYRRASAGRCAARRWCHAPPGCGKTRRSRARRNPIARSPMPPRSRQCGTRPRAALRPATARTSRPAPADETAIPAQALCRRATTPQPTTAIAKGTALALPGWPARSAAPAESRRGRSRSRAPARRPAASCRVPATSSSRPGRRRAPSPATARCRAPVPGQARGKRRASRRRARSPGR